jgi:signal transduction histidine kinase/ActR/RegA family two-component response regulator
MLPRDSFTGASPMAVLMRAFDWASSPLGDAGRWPASLRAVVRLMLDSKFPMFVAWGDDLRLLYNSAYAEILGDKHPSSLGAPIHDVWPEIRDDISPLIDKALAGDAVWVENLPLRIDRFGLQEDAWFTFSCSPARDDDGEIAGMFCAIKETTERTKADREVRDLNAALDQRAAEESSRRAGSEAELRQSQKLEAIGQLTGGVAHDFNNLLTVIRGSVDILRRDGITEEKRTRYIDAIGETADRAAKLTGQLLAFARRQTLKPELFDAGRSLREVAGMIGTLAGSGVAIDIVEPQEPCFIMADRGQFDTALINLSVNARDAMGGEGRLTMTTGPVSGIPAIRTHAPVPGDFVAVTITDTGIGIRPDAIGRIFEPFYTTKEVGKGTGLGLSQVFGFAKQSGGDIRVDSVEGQGTTFTLYLPRAHPEGEVITPEDEDVTLADGGGMCVLLVEDNAQVGEFATQALADLGYDSVHAVDAKNALAELSRDCGRFHIVFSDVVMPGMSGLELGQEIRRLYPDVPVVLTSGYSHVLAQNGRYGFELLHKPYSVEQLARVLNKAVAWAAQRRIAR